ncbi:MAG: sensor histidine kinase [Rhodanobacteraceae bacterium]
MSEDALVSTLETRSTFVALPVLAQHLAGERDAILRDWRSRVEAETESSLLTRLSRAEFYDDIPQFLDRLCSVLRGSTKTVTGRFARYHGAQRWQHGMTLEGVTTEWGLLNEVLMDHIAAASRQSVELDSSSLHAAYRLLAEQIRHGIAFSLMEFDKRQRVEAEARMRDLEAACAQHDEKDKRRGRNLHEASHDLRGSLQLVQMLCELLKTRQADPQTREIAARLCVAAENVNQLVRDLLDLARLEAGREERRIDAFDAAAVLRELCDGMRPMAEAEGLQLATKGEGRLPVRGDALKIKRIAQNLVLNALKYTQAGSVEIGWQQESAQRWLFYVRDSGPGMLSSTAGKLAQSLENAALAGGAETDRAPHLRALPPLTMEDGTGSDGDSAVVERHGEGIGLSIVRQLCELLDAVVEVESAPGRGTMFRILLPNDYPHTEKTQ